MDIILSKDSFEYLENKCALCLDFFKKEDYISLIIHSIDGKNEGLKLAKKKAHIFHEKCIIGKFSSCPLDRCKIFSSRKYKYAHLFAINLIGYSNDYYSLIDNKPSTISVTNVENLNYLDNNGKTLLYCACQRNDEKLIAKLIKCGADVNIGDRNNFTPLMILSSLNFNQSLRKFKDSRIDHININAEDNSGKTAMDYAISTKNFQSLEFIIYNFQINTINVKKIYNEIKYLKEPEDILYNIKNKIYTLLKIRDNDGIVKITFKNPSIANYKPIYNKEKFIEGYN